MVEIEPPLRRERERRPAQQQPRIGGRTAIEVVDQHQSAGRHQQAEQGDGVERQFRKPAIERAGQQQQFDGQLQQFDKPQRHQQWLHRGQAGVATVDREQPV